MSRNFTGAVSVGILSWIWAVIGLKLGLITWVGFIGCTSYYAIGGNLSGLTKSIFCNISGVFWAMVIILLSKYIGVIEFGAILTGIFSFMMCYQSKIKNLAFIPGTFMGACSTFGANGNYELVIISLLCGSLVGYFSDLGGNYLYNFLSKRR